MEFSYHLLIIIAAILLGACLFQKGEKTPGMTAAQLKEADMYRNYAYALFALAAVVAIYYYYVQNNQRAQMHSYKARMCGGRHYY